MNAHAAWTIAMFSLRESLRRRVFVVVAVLTLVFLVLYSLGAWQVFQEVEDDPTATFLDIAPRTLAGATILGLSMFATLFLGCILAVFLTLGAVRGDAERGLLQPVIVRPVSRTTFLAARFLAASMVTGAYVVLVFVCATVITGVIGGWWPDRVLGPMLGLVAAVVVLCGLSVLGSATLGTTANGIAVFMAFGAGLVGGILGQIGEALRSETLERVAEIATWLLPFEALYQSGLADLTADTVGATQFAITLGPFGGANDASWLLWPWSALYLLLVGALAVRSFTRRDV